METLYSQKITKESSSASTQQFLDVAEVKENVIVLKSGSLRSVLAVSAINFDLKSSEEQEAIVAQYMNFLNSLDFPLQVLVRSRKLNIEKYAQFVGEKERQQTNPLLRMQISEYKKYIKELVSVVNVMEKEFFIVIPFSPIESQSKGFFSNLSSLINPRKNIIEKRENFETYKTQLFQRADHVIAGLSGIGLKIIPLETQELVELLFNSYNPTAAIANELADITKLEI